MVDTEDNVFLASLNAATAPDVPLSGHAVSVGRAATNTIVLADPFVSSKQFTVESCSKDGQTQYILKDSSRNGTMVNSQLHRGDSVPLRDRDRIEVLAVSQVGRARSIAFLFNAAKCTGESPAKKLKREDSSVDEVTGKLLEDAICPICQEVLHRAVSVIPCLHNGCSACLSSWFARPGQNTCPLCRIKVTAVQRNRTLEGMIEKLLSVDPKRKRSLDVLAELDAADVLSTAGYDLSKLRPAGPGGPGAPLGGAASDDDEAFEDADEEYSDGDNDTPDEHEGAQCFNCVAPDPHDGFCCRTVVGRPRHVNCIECGDLMPLRPGTAPLRFQSCGICLKYLCAPTRAECRGAPRGFVASMCLELVGTPALKKLRDLDITEEFGLMYKALNGNTFEQGLLEEYLRSRDLRLKDKVLELLANPNPAGVPAVRVNFEHMTIAGNVPELPSHAPWQDIVSCRACAIAVLEGVVYAIRQRIPDGDLPARGQGRENCWYGRGCRTQLHNEEHAQRLNHICEVTVKGKGKGKG
eukprot:gnl/MRDRNA2_/MRDRNA2_70039_c0_seq1.p1 gnl/MRDRNA2_/MRDRNA2_70039_c0~~gnl/MRDRNA2_/MRDRNA2_70039_c0_seq1.p1  ORF type:complete len:595 (+),score=96.16 gnl/MRDRNA2_/MRDRNA2_70039_c0_seq1:214-1785(+)